MCRDLLGNQGKHLKIIAKIENQEGIYNINQILQAADGVMIARGDLGMEMELSKLFVAQNLITKTVRLHKKISVLATQLLESMVYHPRPTRAECTDVAMAATALHDATMLSGETGAGSYPVEAAQTMTSICLQNEAYLNYQKEFNLRYDFQTKLSAGQRKEIGHLLCLDNEVLAKSAVFLSNHPKINAIVCVSNDWDLVRLISVYRPGVPVIFLHSEERTLRSLQL